MAATINNRALLAGLAVGMLAISIPLPWMTINNAKIEFDSPFGDQGPQLQLPNFPSMQLTATGLNGYLNPGIKIPFWLLAAVTAGAAIVALLNELGKAAVPAGALIGVLAAAGLLFAYGTLTFFSGEVTLGIGFPMAFAGWLLAIFVASKQVGGG